MLSVLASLLVALLASISLTPIVRRLALRVGAVDEPAARRVHARRVPRLGGVAIWGAFFIPLALLFVFDTQTGRLLFQRPTLVAGMAVGATMMTLLGIFDDIRGVSAKAKLGVQSLAAVVAFSAGFQINSVYLPGVGTVGLGILALPVTWLWITAVINAVNLIDGLDGLAVGVAFFACVANFVVAWLNDSVLICLLSATLGGALLGFLLYNFNPASIFMGDSGSMFLGFVLATMSLFGAGGQKGSTAIALVVPLLALGLPIVDMLVTMARRFLSHRSIFSADRGHIHHRLLDAGLTHRRAVLILYVLCFVFTAVSLAVHLGRSWQIGLSLIMLTVTFVGISRFTGYFSQNLLRARQIGRGRAMSADVVRFRRFVPSFLQELREAKSHPEIRAFLQDFALRVEVLSVSLQTSAGGKMWLWEDERLTPKIRHDLVSVQFSSGAQDNSYCELEFKWDSEVGEVSPQAEILLQLVADATSEVLETLTRPSLSNEEVGAGCDTAPLRFVLHK